jgi:hypothetical protein
MLSNKCTSAHGKEMCGPIRCACLSKPSKARTIALSKCSLSRQAGRLKDRHQFKVRSMTPCAGRIEARHLRDHHDTGKPTIEACDTQVPGTSLAGKDAAAFARRDPAPTGVGSAGLRSRGSSGRDQVGLRQAGRIEGAVRGRAAPIGSVAPHAARKASTIVMRAARTAGRKPPIRPIASAKPTVLSAMAGFRVKPNASSEND